MKVITRSNLTENLSLDKILNRIKELGNKNNLEVDYDGLGLKVINSIYDGVTTTELDEETARIAATDITNPDNLKLASLIIIDNQHKNTHNSFVEKMRLFMENDIIEKEIWDIVENNQDFFNTNIDYSLDFMFDYFGFKTMEKSYLIKINDKVIERPQDMIMREALGIHRNNLDDVLESYKLLSKGYFTHATPTLFHSCTKRPQHSSCFTGDTRVFTMNRTKRIDEVEIGDMVITHRSNIKKVSQIHKNKLGDRKLYNLYCEGKTVIKVTGNHKFWAKKKDDEKEEYSWIRLDELIPSNHIIKHRGGIKILKKNDCIEYEKIVVESRYSKGFVNIEDIVEITENLPEYVYTLGVEDDHSYSVEGLIVENCFLLSSEDSVEGIYKTVADCAKISQYAGGIGLHLSMIRAAGSKVKGTNGKSGGLPPMLKVLNETARHINQCFEGSTIVYTDKGSKKIENIVVDDMVLTHDGSFNKVEKNNFSSIDKNILSIELTSSYPVKVTEEHVVCVLKNNSRKNKTKFLPASQLERNDYMMFPIPHKNNIDKSLEYNQSFFLGLCFSNSSKIVDETLIVNKLFKNSYDFVVDFCVKNNIYPQIFDSYIKIDLSLFGLSRDMLIKESKKVLFEKVLISEDKIIKNFLSGFLSGTLKNYINNNEDSIYYNISFDSIETCENIKYLMLKLGYLCKSFKTNLCCGLIIPNWNSFKPFVSDPNEEYFFENNSFFCKIKDIKKIPFSGKVYDLTVEENHTYTTSIGAVHNSGRRPGSFACFVKDTEVMTVNEGVKKIQDVKIGDEVVTHKNRVKPVSQIHKNSLGDRKIYKLEVSRNKDIYVTGNHKFWSMKTKKDKSNKISTGWHSVEELKSTMESKDIIRNCYISIPSSNGIEDTRNCKINVMDYQDIIVNNTNSITELQEVENEKIVEVSKSFDKSIIYSKPINKIWNITKDLANLIGFWLGDGNIIKNTEGVPIGIQFTFHNIDVKEINVISKVLKDTFGKEPIIRKDRNIVYITVNSYTIGSIFMELFGCYALDKKLPNMFFSWPKNLVNNLIEGLLDTNGHVRDRKNGNSLDLENENLMNQIYHLCRNNGINVSAPRKEFESSILYTINIPFSENITDNTRKFYNNTVQNYYEESDDENSNFLKILSITETDRIDEFVYTLGIEDDHSYNVEGLLVENCYLEPWHADIVEFLDMKKNDGKEEFRARDLFYAIWMPDLFMECVEKNEDWYLMCPSECPGLNDVYGDEYKKLYYSYVERGMYREKVSAQSLWKRILTSQIETGTPYICYKDACNEKSNQKNLGTIKSSNLCSEIIEYSSPEEIACCFTGDTKVLTIDGYRRIDECDGKKVLSYFNNDSEFKHNEKFIEAKLIDNGKKDVYELECSGTKNIKATSNHLFLTLDKRDYKTYIWKKMSDLKEGDRISLPNNKVLPSYNIEKNTDEDFLTIGWLIGDGWQCYPNKKETENPIYEGCFDSVEGYSRDRVIKKINQWFKECELVKNGVFNWKSSKQNFIKNIQENFGLIPHKARDKVIPEKIMNSESYKIASLLSGLFSADGKVYIKENRKQDFNVGLSSSSKTLLEQVQNLLRCFGISSNIYWQYIKSRNSYQGCLKIEKRNSIENYMKYIGFELCKEKQEKLEYGLNNLSSKEIFTEYAFVKSITYIGVEQVYDLNVPESHNFIAEGVVVHNCNLLSIALPKFVEFDKDDKPYINHDLLFKVAKIGTKNLNNLIDTGFYPLPEAKKSNLKNRPLGIGVQGLAHMYMKYKVPYESQEAEKLNIEIFETIYYGCLTQSMELAKEHGHYQTFKGSPMSEGLFQFDLWKKYSDTDLTGKLSGRWDWDKLREDVIKYGVRNSLLTTIMPTASTAQILSNSECCEPVTSNMFSRRVLSGEFIVLNHYLVNDLKKAGLWDNSMKDLLLHYNGSVQEINKIPDDLKKIYKTVWEIPQKSLINQASDRGLFIDQSQSLNLFLESPSHKKLTSMHFYTWKKGLKTGIYYLRTKSASRSTQVTVDLEKIKQSQETAPACPYIPGQAPPDCESCSG